MTFDTTQSFDRLARLYGEEALTRLSAARVLVFGVGGVGSFVAESLARSGIGAIVLIDGDVVAKSNLNRQLQALTCTLGQSKAVAMRERLCQINPAAIIEAIPEAYGEHNASALLDRADGPVSFVVDCIDVLSQKAHLLAACRARTLSVVSSMGAGGKRDPTRVRIADLARTDTCRLAHQLRKTLRQKHGFAREGLLGITAVFSEEPACLRACEEHARHVTYGTAAFVTGAFGLACASHVVNTIAVVNDDPPPRRPARS